MVSYWAKFHWEHSCFRVEVMIWIWYLTFGPDTEPTTHKRFCHMILPTVERINHYPTYKDSKKCFRRLFKWSLLFSVPFSTTNMVLVSVLTVWLIVVQEIAVPNIEKGIWNRIWFIFRWTFRFIVPNYVFLSHNYWNYIMIE